MILREKRLKYENEKLTQKLKRLAGMDKREKTKFVVILFLSYFRYYTEEANKKIRYLEEQNEKLKREAASAKAEEEGLLNDMESTGQVGSSLR